MKEAGLWAYHRRRQATSCGMRSSSLGLCLAVSGSRAAKVWSTETARSSMSLESLRGDDVPGAADGVCLDPVRIKRSINLGGMLSQRATMTSSLSRTSGVLSRTDLSSARPTKREVSSFAPSSARILGTEGCSSVAGAEVSLILEMLSRREGKNSILLGIHNSSGVHVVRDSCTVVVLEQ